jgi:hypothetical protein
LQPPNILTCLDGYFLFELGWSPLNSFKLWISSPIGWDSQESRWTDLAETSIVRNT